MQLMYADIEKRSARQSCSSQCQIQEAKSIQWLLLNDFKETINCLVLNTTRQFNMSSVFKEMWTHPGSWCGLRQWNSLTGRTRLEAKFYSKEGCVLRDRPTCWVSPSNARIFKENVQYHHNATMLKKKKPYYSQTKSNTLLVI